MSMAGRVGADTDDAIGQQPSLDNAVWSWARVLLVKHARQGACSACRAVSVVEGQLWMCICRTNIWSLHPATLVL
jgi:hypothetical protein